MINFRKIMLGTGAMTAAVAPVVGVVSCGDEGYHWDGNYGDYTLDYWQTEQPEIYNKFNENFAHENAAGEWYLDWTAFPGNINEISAPFREFENSDKVHIINHFPTSVSKIEDHAFEFIPNLTLVQIVSENLKYIGKLFGDRSEEFSMYDDQMILDDIYLDCPNAEIIDGAFSDLMNPEARALTIRLPKKFDSDSERGRLFGRIYYYDEFGGRGYKDEATPDDLWEYGHIICVYQDR